MSVRFLLDMNYIMISITILGYSICKDIFYLFTLSMSVIFFIEYKL